MTNDITIRSGIDINSNQFKDYYDSLKKAGINCYFLDLALSLNSEVLINPIVFEEKDYDDFKVDDISFVIRGNEIIGHQVYNIEKLRNSIPLGMGTPRGLHLDLDEIKKIGSVKSFNKKESYYKYNIEINKLIIEYLTSRTHGKLEYKGTVTIEPQIHIKK